MPGSPLHPVRRCSPAVLRCGGGGEKQLQRGAASSGWRWRGVPSSKGGIAKATNPPSVYSEAAVGVVKLGSWGGERWVEVSRLSW